MPTATHDFITADEVARELRVSPNTVRAWLSTGKLRGFKVSHKVWRIQRQDFEDFVQAGIRAGIETSDQHLPEAVDVPPGSMGKSLTVRDLKRDMPTPAPARTRAAKVRCVRALHAEGLSHQKIADRLNTDKIPTLSGTGKWHAGTVGKLLAQAAGN